ncbi:hypothetical protein XANCAGTX0491_010012 [Xanthoria calcicola]
MPPRAFSEPPSSGNNPDSFGKHVAAEYHRLVSLLATHRAEAHRLPFTPKDLVPAKAVLIQQHTFEHARRMVLDRGHQATWNPSPSNTQINDILTPIGILQPSLLHAPSSTPSPVTPPQKPIAYAPHAVHDSESDSEIQFVGSQPSSRSNISVSRSSTRRKKRDHGPSRQAARAFAQEETPSKGPRKKDVEAKKEPVAPGVKDDDPFRINFPNHVQFGNIGVRGHGNVPVLIGLTDNHDAEYYAAVPGQLIGEYSLRPVRFERVVRLDAPTVTLRALGEILPIHQVPDEAEILRYYQYVMRQRHNDENRELRVDTEGSAVED